ncbi:response regulator transcription factor [Methylobacterium sp. ID0610]|uniref:response regulator transcription factor n=1 Tax=Methylobacterium carpenticola TaxID=3344827 RepID=UPI003685AB15
MREGLKRLLVPKGFNVIATENRLGEAARPGGAPETPAIVILCAQPKTELSLDEVRAARTQFPHSVLVCLCATSNEAQIVPMLETGAAAILTQATGVNTLIQAAELALMGHRVVPCLPQAATETAEEEPAAPAQAPAACNDPAAATQSFRPSAREVKIIACLVRGESNRDIAQQLAIPVGRVKGHVKAILRKMRVQNRTQAAIWGMKNRLGSEPGAMADEDAGFDGSLTDGGLPMMPQVGAVASPEMHAAALMRPEIPR